MTTWVTPPSKPPKSGIESSTVNGRLLVDGTEIVVYNDSLSTLTTTDKSSLTNAINENVSQLAETMNVADWVDARNYGVVANTGTDMTQQVKDAINAAITKKVPIKFPSGAIRIYSTINITTKQMRFIGTYGAPSESGANGTTFLYYGTGAMFEFGSDDGIPYDDSTNYNGVQGAYFEHIRMVAGNQNTALENGSGNYSLGTYAIKDWRGGSFVLEDIFIVGFEYGFWGLKSDYNLFTSVTINGCKTALHLDARCDQNTIIHLSTNNNDRAVHINQAHHTRFIGCQFVVDGSPTTNPIRIGSSHTSGATGTIFEGCWFERYVNGGIEAFVEIGVGDAVGVTTTDITFRDCAVLTGSQGGTGYAQYFVKVGRTRRVNIENIINGNIDNLKKIMYCVGTYPQEVFAKIHDDFAINGIYETDGTSSPNVSVYSYGKGLLTFYSPGSRFAIRSNPLNTLRDYRFTTEYGDKTFAIDFYNTGDGNLTRFKLSRRYIQGTAAPTSNTWGVGDYVQNINPIVQGTAGSQYIIRGWTCTVAGTPGTWVQDRGYTGT